jgi:hypothetical protein
MFGKGRVKSSYCTRDCRDGCDELVNVLEAGFASKPEMCRCDSRTIEWDNDAEVVKATC